MKQERSKDADYVNSIIARYSENARNTGKLIAVLVLVLSLILPDCKTSFQLAMIYIGLEYAYAVSITIINKIVLRKYFTPIEDGFALNEGADVSSISREIANYGTLQMIFNSLILITSVICLI